MTLPSWKCRALLLQHSRSAIVIQFSVGEAVYVAGNPKKWKGSFSIGFVNAIRPEGNQFISGKILHISAPVSLGSSGGPVMNKHGEVIAILGGQEFDTQNLNFAVSVNHLKALLKTIQ